MRVCNSESVLEPILRMYDLFDVSMRYIQLCEKMLFLHVKKHDVHIKHMIIVLNGGIIESSKVHRHAEHGQ